MESYRTLKIFCEHFVLHALMVNFEKCYVLIDAMNRAGISFITAAAVCKYEGYDSLEKPKSRNSCRISTCSLAVLLRKMKH